MSFRSAAIAHWRLLRSENTWRCALRLLYGRFWLCQSSAFEGSCRKAYSSGIDSSLNFQLKVINLEFILPGNSKRELDRQIDKVSIDLMKRAGYDLVSRANNHAIDHRPEGVSYNTELLQEAGLKMIGPRAAFLLQLGNIRG